MKQAWPLLICVLLGGCTTMTPPKVQRVEFGGSIWSAAQHSAGVMFQDGAQSTPVHGGTLWTFGDTFLGPAPAVEPPKNSQITGATGTTIAFLPAGQTNIPPQLQYFIGSNGTATNPLSLLPGEPAATNRMWPAGAVALGDRIYLFYSMIEKTGGPAPWNFRDLGGGLAVADQPMCSFTRLRPGGHWKYPVEPVQVVREGSWLYLFEISRKPAGLILARVGADAIKTPAAYEFSGSHGWSTNRSEARVILPEAHGQVSVVWSPALRCYLMATSSDFIHPREIQLRKAKHCGGPWSEPARIAVPELPGHSTMLVYGTFLHPELGDDRSLRYTATFCRMLAGEWDLANPEWLTFTLAP